jgi:broad specificity phosphatase PhoE
MQILLFRHAERENTGLENPPLSVRGQHQAQAIKSGVSKGTLPHPSRLYVSPKIRTHQTFGPAAEWTRLELQLTPELDERQNSESASQFAARVRRFLSFLEKQTGVIYVCTHLDWIEEALIAIPSPEDLSAEKFQAWAPAQYIEFDLQEGLWLVLKSGRM